ncbi:MAG: trypsin-like peptidase domain-containing protein [Chromatiaceae bacterium]|jgi:S1-C subfamily serine protease
MVAQSIRLRRLLRRLLLTVLIAPLPLHASPDQGNYPDFGDGWTAYEARDYEKAVAIWTVLAENGHINAQANLGFMYDHGTGVNQDQRLAAQWYRAAASQGSAAGQYNLALLISEGGAEPVAGRSARYWLERAAAQGFEDAVRKLGEDAATAASRPESRGDISPSQTRQPAIAHGQTKSYTVEIPVSTGTAWPVAAGYAVTNHHIIEGKRQFTLINKQGDEIKAKVIASDAQHDIAFLRVSNPHRLPPALPLSLSSASLGASVFTIGFPRVDIMGKSPKLSQGIISGVNGLQDDPNSYQISVPIQQGNSGGPLLNMRGEVVGMITSMLGEVGADDRTAQPVPNFNYALKIDVIREFMSQIPRPENDISELDRAVSDLESLAARVQDSVLIIMAE